MKSNKPIDIFNYIDTHNNDPTVCWEWKGTTGGRDGRGYISIEGKKKLVHRVMYELFNPPIGNNMVVRHTCDNPICCNPKHLVIGTRSQNEEDKYQRDRWGYTKDMVREMRRASLLGMSYRDIADHINKKFHTSVSASGVGKVVRGDRRTK